MKRTSHLYLTSAIIGTAFFLFGLPWHQSPFGENASVSGVVSTPTGSAATSGRLQTSDTRTSAASKRLRKRFPDILLTTHENRQLRFYDDLVKGKVVLINFMYTSCTGI